MSHSTNDLSPRLREYLRRVLADDARSAPTARLERARGPRLGPGSGDGHATAEAEHETRPVEEGPTRRVAALGQGRAIRAPAPIVNHSKIAKISTARLRPTAKLALAKQRKGGIQPVYKGQLLVSKLPTLITPTIVSGENEDPVPAGDYLLWPDPSAGRAYFVGSTPTVQELEVTARRNASFRMTGGTASIVVSAFPAADSATVSRLHDAWGQALTAAGHGRRQWRYGPLQISQLHGTLDLPADYVAAAPRATPNPHLGSIIYLVDLTAIGAQAWADFLRTGQSPLGVCRLTYTFSAEGASGRLVARQRSTSASIQSLARGFGPESLRIVDPKVEVDATLLVDGHPTIEAITVEMRASVGQVETQVFGSEGGTVILRLASATPDEEFVEWSVRVSFTSASWPAVSASGTLSADTGWADLITPTSWLRQTTITAMLLNEAGEVLPQSDPSVVDAENRVTGALDFSADFLDDETELQTSFETSSRQVATVIVPDPPGEASGQLKLTAFALRNGRDAFLVRDLAPDERWVLIKVYPNARIEIATNRTPTSEMAREREVTTALETLGPAPAPADATGPSVVADVEGRGDGGPPRFRVETGRNPYWALEIAADASLFDHRNASLRDDSNFWTSGEEGHLALRRETTMTLPRPVWDTFRRAERLFYRIWTSRSRTDWDRPETSLPDAIARHAPYISPTELRAPAHPAVTGPSEPVDDAL